MGNAPWEKVNNRFDGANVFQKPLVFSFTGGDNKKKDFTGELRMAWLDYVIVSGVNPTGLKYCLDNLKMKLDPEELEDTWIIGLMYKDIKIGVNYFQMQIGLGESRKAKDKNHKEYFERAIEEETGLKICEQNPANWNYHVFKRYKESCNQDFYPPPNAYEHNFIFTMNITELEPLRSNSDNLNPKPDPPAFNDLANPYVAFLIYGTFDDMVKALSSQRVLNQKRDLCESDLTIIPYHLVQEVTDKIWLRPQGQPYYVSPAK